MSEYVLELKGITKIFPGVKALNNVQFQLKPGEVHALMGENGAGKSTFIKVITGVHKAEEGEMFLNGQKVDFKGPKDAQAAGVKNGDIVSVKADNERGTIFNQVAIRVDDSFTLEMHIDTDEANAAKIATGNTVTIIK